MSDSLMLAKYSAARMPTVAFSDEAAAVSVAFSHMPQPLGQAQIPQAHTALKQGIESAYPTARWNRDEVVERDGRRYVVLDFWAPAQTGETRNIMVITTLGGRLFTANFNAASYLAESWSDVGEAIMASLRVDG